MKKPKQIMEEALLAFEKTAERLVKFMSTADLKLILKNNLYQKNEFDGAATKVIILELKKRTSLEKLK